VKQVGTRASTRSFQSNNAQPAGQMRTWQVDAGATPAALEKECTVQDLVTLSLFNESTSC
jgi:hypothetical protein